MKVVLWKYAVRVLVVNFLILIAVSCLAELLYSSYHYFYSSDKSVWIFEDVGKTMQFDPIRGYVLTQIPSRFARITRGEIEYIGTLRGNAQGFPDRDDFTPKRARVDTKRFAVFGDSFTAAQFLAVNWPERAEDLLRREGGRIELLNFSVDGGGLANWASIIRSILQAQHYELDGLIFVICCNDLDRTFAFTDNRNRSKYAFAHTSSWDPQTYPKSMDAVTKKTLEESERASSFILTTDEFNEVLKGRLLTEREWRFALFERIRSTYWEYVRRRQNARTQESSAFNAGQLRLIEGIRDFAKRQNLPTLVIFVGGRDDSISREEHIYIRKTRQFAKLLGAEFLDGRMAFDGMTNAQLHKLWLPYDGHWGLGGSDVFAAYMTQELKKRLENGGR